MTKKIFWNSYAVLKESYSWILYIIFAFYIGYITITTTADGIRLLYFFVGVLILAGCLYYEYLKKLYRQMIQALTVNGDINASRTYRAKLQERDIVHGFKHSILLFDTLLLVDSGAYQECLDLMEANKKFFHSSIDYLFIKYHTQMFCYYYLNEYELGLTVAPKILEIKSMNKKKYSPLFSWQEVEGLIFTFKGRNQKAIDSFQQVNQSSMNTRERAHLLMLMAERYRDLGNTGKFGKYRKQAIALAPTIKIEKVKPYEKIHR